VQLSGGAKTAPDASHCQAQAWSLLFMYDLHDSAKLERDCPIFSTAVKEGLALPNFKQNHFY
jgi:hypothetical protein